MNPSVKEQDMNKILVGLIAGAVFGVIDGATAWFTPEVRKQMLGIIIGSTGKGIIAGIAAGCRYPCKTKNCISTFSAFVLPGP